MLLICFCGGYFVYNIRLAKEVNKTLEIYITRIYTYTLLTEKSFVINITRHLLPRKYRDTKYITNSFRKFWMQVTHCHPRITPICGLWWRGVWKKDVIKSIRISIFHSVYFTLPLLNIHSHFYHNVKHYSIQPMNTNHITNPIHVSPN